MTSRIGVWLAGAVGVIVAGSAVAAPLELRRGLDAAHGNAIVKVHGCHYDCRFSPRLGWHNHSNAECRPEACRDRRRDYESGDGFYRGGHRGHGGHPCHYDCRFSPEFGWHNHSNAQCRPEPCRRR